jgi:hypothetical protein
MLAVPMSLLPLALTSLVMQTGRTVSLLDPLTATLKPLASFGSDWTNTGSTGLGCNATHCISIGSFAMSPWCIGVFELADPTRIRAAPLKGLYSFSAPAFVHAGGTMEWQVLDHAGGLHRIDDDLSLQKIASAASFHPPYYYHATPVPTRAHTLWCALSAAAEPKGQVEGCFNASNMAAATRSPAGTAGYDTNIADCGFSAGLGRLVCAGHNGKQYGVVAFDAHTPSMPSRLLGADARTAGWQYGFGVTKFAALGNSSFVMLAQPNLGVQQHSELLVTRWDPVTGTLSAVARASQPALDDAGNSAWAVVV